MLLARKFNLTLKFVMLILITWTILVICEVIEFTESRYIAVLSFGFVVTQVFSNSFFK